MKFIAMAVFVLMSTLLVTGCKTATTSQNTALVAEPIMIVNKTSWRLSVDDGTGIETIVWPNSSVELKNTRSDVTLKIKATEKKLFGCLIDIIDRGSSVRHVGPGSVGHQRSVVVSKWNLH